MLYICHVTRDDLIVGFMGECQSHQKESEQPFEAALLVCGQKGKYQLSPEVSEMMEGVDNAPIMMVDGTTHEAMRKIHNYTLKLNIHDTNHVSVAVDQYKPYIDFD
jgi:BioD-like phosphotransacetylase family protein